MAYVQSKLYKIYLMKQKIKNMYERICNLLAVCLLFVVSCEGGSYKDSTLPVEKRVENLLSLMTLEEKVGQMNQFVGLDMMEQTKAKKLSRNEMMQGDEFAYYPGYPTDTIVSMIKSGLVGSFLHVQTLKEANELQRWAMESRLGIPLLFGIDAIHGNAFCPNNTVYPTNIGLASSFDTDLAYEIARQTAKEMRAMNMHWTFNPNIEVARDARWGRCGETFGEDPYLVGQMGAQTVKGYQGGLDPQNTCVSVDESVLACIKHLTGGSQPVNGTNCAPAEITERTLRDVFFPPYIEGIKAGALSLMPSHNDIGGVPCHSSKWLLTDVLRDEWKFEGFVVSDWKDLEKLSDAHFTAKDHKDAFFQGIVAGIDMHMHGPEWNTFVCELVREGKISEKRIDESVRRILTAKFRLGLFEKPYADEEQSMQVRLCEEHRQTALKAARKSIVLLKNENVLPLDRAVRKKIMLTGINADHINMMGDWVSYQHPDNYTTIIEGLREVAPENEYIYIDQGPYPTKMTMGNVKQAAETAKECDLNIVVAGDYMHRGMNSKMKTAGENADRSDVNLPGLQHELIRQVAASGKPTILILVSGRPLSIEWEAENIPAIVEAWEPGMYGGQAVAEILFGDVNPSAKLAMSFPRSAGHIQTYYNHKAMHYYHPYRVTSSTPLWPFGHGLSYTSYEYSEPVLNSAEMRPGQSLTVSVDVTNVGCRAGEEVVQMYIRDNVAQVARPVKELKGFCRVVLEPGETKTVTLPVTEDMLSFYGLDMEPLVEDGTFTVMVGSSSDDKFLKSVEFTFIK